MSYAHWLLCNDHLLTIYDHLLDRRSTSEHSSVPRTHKTVPVFLSVLSGIMHFSSSTLGQGQSAGLETQTRVAGQRYSPHGTKGSCKFTEKEVHIHKGERLLLPASAWLAHWETPEPLCCCCWPWPNICSKKLNCAMASGSRQKPERASNTASNVLIVFSSRGRSTLTRSNYAVFLALLLRNVISVFVW